MSVKIELDFYELTEALDRLTEDKRYAATLQGELTQVKLHMESLKSEINHLRKNPPAPPITSYPTNALAGRHIRELIKMQHDQNKIGCIKVIREVMGLGLKEAKDFYEEIIPNPPYKGG
jgi:Ribosomal protein L7/L12 C-terminal domain